jgi:hypothetical protein
VLSKLEINNLIDELQNLRKQLLWLINQNPVNEIQKEYIKKGIENLRKVNSLLGDFGVKLPN